MPTPGSFESRAQRVFIVLAAFIAIVGLVVLAGNGSTTTLLVRIGMALAVSSAVAIYGIEARGLAVLRPWAVAAAAPLLIVVILFDVFNVLAGFGQSRLNLPIATVLAVWAFRGRRAVAPTPRLGPGAIALVTAGLVVSLMTYTVAPVLGPGGVLDVHDDDLEQALTVDCGTGVAAPETLAITYRWSWRRQAFLASGDDAIVIRWFVEGNPYVRSAEDVPAPVGLLPDTSGPMSGALAQAYASESRNSLAWSIDLADLGLDPGEVRLVLRRAPGSTPPSEPFTVDARYVHLGAWRGPQLIQQCDWH